MQRVLVLLSLLLLLSCNKDEKTLRKSSVEGQQGRQVIGNTVLEAFGEERMLWRLTADEMLREESLSDVHVTPVHLLMYDDTGAVTTVVKADSGKTPNDMNSFFIWGAVAIETVDGKKIRSRSLSWNKEDRELHSDDFVEITIPSGEKMRGKGFDAAEDFSWWKFYRAVSGDFPGFKKMVGIDEDDPDEE